MATPLSRPLTRLIEPERTGGRPRRLLVPSSYRCQGSLVSGFRLGSLDLAGEALELGIARLEGKGVLRSGHGVGEVAQGLQRPRAADERLVVRRREADGQVRVFEGALRFW